MDRAIRNGKAKWPVFAVDASTGQFYCAHCGHFVQPIRLTADTVLHCGTCNLSEHCSHGAYKRALETGKYIND